MYIVHTVRTNQKAIRIFTILNCLYLCMCVHPHTWQCTRYVDGTSPVLLLWTPSWNPCKLQDHRIFLSQIRDALLTTLLSQRAPTRRVQMGLGHNSPSLTGFWLAAAVFPGWMSRDLETVSHKVQDLCCMKTSCVYGTSTGVYDIFA